VGAVSWRPVYDTAIALAVVGAVFSAGALHRRVQEHGEAIAKLAGERGAVRISMEADQRLTKLETTTEWLVGSVTALLAVQGDLAEIRALQADATRRLERIERKLDR